MYKQILSPRDGPLRDSILSSQPATEPRMVRAPIPDTLCFALREIQLLDQATQL